MSYEPDPLQRLLLWRLAVSDDGGEFLKNIKPEVTAPRRAPLQREGLLSEAKRKPPEGGRALKHLELTEKGWAWCQNHLEAELSRSQLASVVLQRILGLLKRYFESQPHTVSFGQLVQQARTKSESSSTPTDAEAEVGDLEQAVRKTCLELGGGRNNVRVYLKDLRHRLHGVSGPELDAMLLRMESEGKLRLMQNDNPQEITVEDRSAALRTATGAERHILYYFGGNSS